MQRTVFEVYENTVNCISTRPSEWANIDEAELSENNVAEIFHSFLYVGRTLRRFFSMPSRSDICLVFELLFNPTQLETADLESFENSN